LFFGFKYGKNSKKKNENSNLHGFEVHRPSSKGTKLLLQVIKAIINQNTIKKCTEYLRFEKLDFYYLKMVIHSLAQMAARA